MFLIYYKYKFTETVLNNIDDTIEKNIFRNDILIESFFDNNVHEYSDYTINVDTMKEILETLKEIKDIIQNPIFSDSK